VYTTFMSRCKTLKITRDTLKRSSDAPFCNIYVELYHAHHKIDHASKTHHIYVFSGVIKAYASEVSDKTNQARVFTLLTITMSIGIIIGPAFGGYMMCFMICMM